MSHAPCFASDNYAGVHPAVLAAIAAANGGFAPAYGDDDWTLALQERIFEPFYRLPGATERDGGVGLGLALVKSIAQRHGGRVYCENRDGGGACFAIELPLEGQ